MNRLHIECLGSGKPLVLLHGWSMHSGIWYSFAEKLAEDHEVVCVDLPGHGFSPPMADFTITSVAKAILQRLDYEEFSILGWSMGASIGIEMARIAPSRVRNLLMLAGNPCFVEQAQWPGIKLQVLEQFGAELARDPDKTLMRFLGLQIKGIEDGKNLLSLIRQQVTSRPSPSVVTLQQGLDLLRHSDLRKAVLTLVCPVHLILGTHDTLVPFSLVDAIEHLKSDIKVLAVERGGHVPFLTHEKLLLDYLREVL